MRPLAALGLLTLLASAPAHAAPPWLSVRVESPGAITSPAIAERAARTYLADHLDRLAPSATAADFRLLANQLDGDLRTVTFQQTWRGLRVVGASLGFVFARDRLFVIRANGAANVTATIATRTNDTSRAEAWLLAQTGHRARVQRTGELVVLRVADRYEIADVLDAQAIDAPDRWTVYVAADGAPLRRDSLIMTATGTLQYNAGVRYARGTREDFAAPTATITVNTLTTTTSPTGTFSWTGTSAATVVPALAGTYVRVINQAGASATASLTAQPAGTVVWDLSTDETGDAQLSTYIYANRAKARARIVNPALATWLDTQLDFYVNEMGTCNAYSTGSEVHLFRAGTGCENTGRVADVVFHEFGHSVHNQSIISGMGAFESNLSEGLADFFAANLTEDSQVGRGFFLDDAPLRNIDPPGTERVYPVDFDFDPHVSGLIISGALWDLRTALIESLGYAAGVTRAEKIFTGVMQRADDISTTFNAALIADDDDADLSNGTPNFCLIENAFGRHGLVVGYQTTTVDPPVLDGRHITLAVHTPVGTTCQPPTVQRISVAWKAGDGVASVFDLTPDADGWSGDLPDQPNGTVIRYSIDIELGDGTTQVYPNNPADPLYQLMIGTPSPIWCEPMDADPRWDQTSNAGLAWQWGTAAGAPSSGDPAIARTGTTVLGTILTGDGHYRANAVISATTPSVDVSRYQYVHLQYWRWLTVEDAHFDEAAILANGQQVWRNASAENGTLDHVDREWRFQDVDVTPYVSADGTMQISWSLTSDFGKELGGWTLDDVCFVGLDSIGRCGDGIVEDGEQCDDGGMTNGDGCNSQCILEPTSGGGGGCSTGSPGDGSLVLVLGALAQCWRRRSSAVPSRSVSARTP
ncbi:MAG TPA: hypothetical protein VLB44_07570 [Kofleriaceae bacterium]|nr:hypothetical protein [Kofleriaceae bacterium]